jgi:hypothetical protein
MTWFQRQAWALRVLMACTALVLACLVCTVLTAIVGPDLSHQTATSGAAATLPGTATEQASPGAQSAGSATATEKPPPPIATPAPLVTETIASGNWEYTITQVKRTNDPLVWTQFGNKTVPKGEWLIIDLTLKNVGKEAASIHTGDFDVVDGNGVRYHHGTTVGTSYAFQQFHKLSRLGEPFPPGAPIRTALVFDIPPEAKNLKLDLKQAGKMVPLGQ